MLFPQFLHTLRFSCYFPQFFPVRPFASACPPSSALCLRSTRSRSAAVDHPHCFLLFISLLLHSFIQPFGYASLASMILRMIGGLINCALQVFYTNFLWIPFSLCPAVGTPVCPTSAVSPTPAAGLARWLDHSVLWQAINHPPSSSWLTLSLHLLIRRLVLVRPAVVGQTRPFLSPTI